MGCAVVPGYAKRVSLSISSASSSSPSSRPRVLALRRAGEVPLGVPPQTSYSG